MSLCRSGLGSGRSWSARKEWELVKVPKPRHTGFGASVQHGARGGRGEPMLAVTGGGPLMLFCNTVSLRFTEWPTVSVTGVDVNRDGPHACCNSSHVGVASLGLYRATSTESKAAPSSRRGTVVYWETWCFRCCPFVKKEPSFLVENLIGLEACILAREVLLMGDRQRLWYENRRVFAFSSERLGWRGGDGAILGE